MILTGKAKQDFLQYLVNTRQDCIEKGVLKIHWQEFPKTYLNALIIEWFDSVGIEIFTVSGWRYTTGERYGIDVEIVSENDRYMITDSNTRLEATTKAIEKANTIYNNL